MRAHHQHQQQQQGIIRPQSAVAGLQAAHRKARPMTAGPSGSAQQRDAASWRPLSGSPQRRTGAGRGHSGDWLWLQQLDGWIAGSCFWLSNRCLVQATRAEDVHVFLCVCVCR
jgi:hypothetical protein